MAETIAPGKRPQKENIFVHHFFYGSYHRGENMVVHSLAEIEKCPTCQKKEELRQKQIVALQQQRERVKRLVKELEACRSEFRAIRKEFPRTREVLTHRMAAITAILKEMEASNG